MKPSLTRLQAQLGAGDSGIQVRGAFVVTDRPRDEDNLDGLAALSDAPVIGWLVMIPVVCIEAWRWARSGGQRSARSYVVVVTSHGVGVGQLSGWRTGVSEWIVEPDSGVRYELDYSLVAEASDEVELNVGSRQYWAMGPERDKAYRFFGRQ